MQPNRPLFFFYDTETTGLPDWSTPSEAPHQPHLVQLAAILVDPSTREIVQSIDLIVRPDAWEIPTEVSDIHGITTERALDEGVSEMAAVSMLMELWAGRRVRIGHNESFDARILRIALKRYFTDDIAEEWKAGAAQCTARLATPICALPPTEKMKAARRFHHKTPNLTEAYKVITGRDLEDAHSAMPDVLACKDIYFGIADRELAAVEA
jgi:DNA polymerase-3 subunit epsilon